MTDRPIAIVTGSATRIGGGIAARLVADGWRVAMISRNAKRLKIAATSIGAPASAHPADLPVRFSKPVLHDDALRAGLQRRKPKESP